MCGLIGWVGSSPEHFNYSKFHTLGVMNEARGKHSCGVSLDGEIWTGVNDVKLFRNFSPDIRALLDKYPLENSVVIGHTRWATGGSHTADNAHPFGFGGKKDSFDFIGAHNGSLLNHKFLANKYKIDLKVPGRKEEKIDSEILLEIIYKHGIEVLNEYLGAAALIWYDNNEDNTLYVYHGKSKLYHTTKVDSEERPLFFLIEENGVYLSSLEDSLESINDTGGFIGSFEHNKVYKIVDGNVLEAETIEIDRTGKYQKNFAYSRNTDYSYNNVYTYNPNKNTSTPAKIEAPKKEEKTLNIREEKVKGSFNKIGSVYYNRMRYWASNSLISGVYAPIKGNSMYYLGSDTKKAMKSYNKLADNKKFDKTPILFYFFKGILLDTELDFNIAIGRSKTISLEDLSHMSRYPIIDLSNSGAKIINNGQNTSDFVLPFLSQNVYTISKGICLKKEPHENKFNEFKDAILESDQIILKALLGDEVFSTEHDEEELKIITEELESQIQQAEDDIKESISDAKMKKESLSVVSSIKTYCNNKLNALWETLK